MARNTLAFAVFIISLLVSPFLANPVAFATSGMTVQPGLPVFNQPASAGYRERLLLLHSGDFHLGYSTLDGLPHIIIYAPGSSAPDLIVRELEHGANRRTLLITASSDLARYTTRATILFPETYADLVLLEHTPVGWAVHEPNLMSVGSDTASSHSDSVHRVAFTTKSLGLFWLVPRDQSDLTRAMLEQDMLLADGRPGGIRTHGLIPLASAFAVLLAGWRLSQWLHRQEQTKPVTE